MKFIYKNLDKLSISLPAKPSKRFVACVIDMVIVFFVSIVVFSGIFRIVENTAIYKNEEKIIKEEINYYNNLVKESHIVEFDGNQRIDREVTIMKNLTRSIYSSYVVLGNSQQSNFIIDDEHSVTSNGLSSLENDSIAYFYTQYIQNNDDLSSILDDDPLDYLINVYKSTFGSNFDLLFTYNEEIYELPILKTEIAYCIFHYIFVSEVDSVGEEGKTYYDLYFRNYSKMLDNAENLILNSEPYNSVHYKKYFTSYCNQARYINLSLVLSIIITYLMVVLLPKYIFKNERTIGYLLMGLGVINKDKKANCWYIVLIKSLIGCIGFVIVSFMRYLTPPFNGSFDVMYLPISANLNISFSFILLIICLLGFIINVISLFNNNRQNILNIIFNDIVVDINYIDDDNYNYDYQGRPY